MSTSVIEHPTFAISNSVESWRHEREDRGFLMLTRTRFQASRFGSANASLDPRSWLEVREQGALRAGCGFALASCLEVVHWLKTGRVVRLSGAFAYISAQKLSGLLGHDAGATMCGTVKAAKVLGACREELLPTTEHYCDTFSLRARRNARRFRVLSHSMLADYNDAHQFLAAGVGAILLALPWRESLACSDGLIEEETGQSQGTQVIAVVGISDCRFDASGRPYLIAANSQGQRWGDGGFARIAPHLFDRWGDRHDAMLVGLSDQCRYTARRINCMDPTQAVAGVCSANP